MPASGAKVCLGHISAAHGVRGDVLIKSHTDVPEDIAGYGPLQDQDGTRTFAITIKQTTNKGVVAHIAGIDTRTAAEALKGTQLFIDRDRLPAPDPGEWYQADLIGLGAVDPDGRSLGTVVAVQNFGAGDLLELRPQTGGETVLVPFTNETVPEIDLADQRVVINPPPGLLGEG